MRGDLALAVHGGDRGGNQHQRLQAQADGAVQAHGGVGQEWEAVAAAGSPATPAAPSSCLSLTTRMGQLGVEHPKPEFGIAEEGAEKQDGVEDDTKEEESIDSEQDGEDVREREALVATGLAEKSFMWLGSHAPGSAMALELAAQLLDVGVRLGRAARVGAEAADRDHAAG